MSAARAAARTKPVLVVKPGRLAGTADGGDDQVYSEAFRRAGVLRIHEMDTLFDAAKTLAKGRPLGGGNLAVLTNGGSLGVMCADTLLAGGGKLAVFSDDTRSELGKLLGPNWDRDGVVDMGCTAKVRHYQAALAVLLKDKSPSAVLIIHVPFAMVPSEEVALAVIDQAACPPLGVDPGQRMCAFPTRLSLSVEASGAAFTQAWRVYSPQNAALPFASALWPSEVKVDGKEGAVVADASGSPAVRLMPGEHLVTGRLTWKNRPRVVFIPPQTGLVELTRDQKPVVNPQIDRSWL